jgi:hypothetical protein
LLLISAWNRPHVWHRFTNTTDVLATIESMLALDHLSQFDAYARPLHGVFASEPDTTPYRVIQPQISLTEKNPPHGPGSAESSHFDFRVEDLADDDRFNRVLWLAIKGDPPHARRLPAGEREVGTRPGLNRQMHETTAADLRGSEAAVEGDRQFVPLEDPPEELAPAGIATERGRVMHEPAADSLASHTLIDDQIQHIQLPDRAIGFIAERIDEVAGQLSIQECPDAGERRPRTEAIAQVGVGVELKVGVVAE